MHLMKYLIISIIALLQIITFCIASSKYIVSNDKRDKFEYLIISLSGLIGFILFTNPVVLLY